MYQIVYISENRTVPLSYYRQGRGWGWNKPQATKFASLDAAKEVFYHITKPGPTTYIINGRQ